MDRGSDRPGQADGRTVRWAGQRERRRAEFVDAALIAIGRYGSATSVEQIAGQAGVARTRLYKHFTDANDLHRAIAARAGEMLTRELEPMWTEPGPPAARIGMGVRTHLRWITEHSNLYFYGARHAFAAEAGHTDAISDIKTLIGGQLSRLFHFYLSLFGLDTRVAESLGFGIVGLVESAGSRWLEHPNRMSREQLAKHLEGWIWRMLDATLQAVGLTLDPNVSLPAPSQIDPRQGLNPPDADGAEAGSR